LTKYFILSYFNKLEKIKGALKKGISTPPDIKFIALRLSRACKSALRPTLDSLFPIVFEFFSTLLREI
jgi:hypothetical protein